MSALMVRYWNDVRSGRSQPLGSRGRRSAPSLPKNPPVVGTSRGDVFGRFPFRLSHGIDTAIADPGPGTSGGGEGMVFEQSREKALGEVVGVAAATSYRGWSGGD